MSLLCRLLFFLVVILSFALPTKPTLAQPRRGKKEKETPPQQKQELFTLRYKPQAGTVLYDVQTTVTHDQENGKIIFPVRSEGQLAYETKHIDLKNELWSFDRYFTKLTTFSNLPGRAETSTYEAGAVAKKTQITYTMTGDEINRVQLDSMRFTNAESQVHLYFFQAPRLLNPLPTGKIPYGYSWKQQRLDTVYFRDTVTSAVGSLYYDVEITYTFDTVQDTLGGVCAVISGKRTGQFRGSQTNFDVGLVYDGPIEGKESTFLNLETGLVLYRALEITIPVEIDAKGYGKYHETLRAQSSAKLNTSNTRSTRKFYEQTPEYTD